MISGQQQLDSRCFAALFDLSRSKNVEKASDASREIRALAVSMVFADARNIGWQVTGRYPNRREGEGLLPSNHYLSAMIHYLFRHRPGWPPQAAIGKTVVSTGMIDLIARKLGRELYEVPVGFKWFVEGLACGALGFGGEESAGATFLRRDGRTWTTEKDGIVPCLLAAEMTAVTGRDPGEIYRELESDFGALATDRVDASATPEQKAQLAKLSPAQIRFDQLAGEPIVGKVTTASGNGAPIGGIKVLSAGGWFAARPSGTENIYKIYAESSRGEAHLRRILAEAQAIVDAAIAPRPS
jgi:phosphoglucomutase